MNEVTIGGMPASQEEEVSRRSFVKVAVGGMCLAYAAAVGYPIYRYLESPVQKATLLASIKEVSLKDADRLPAGSVLVFKFGPFPAMLIHHLDGQWVSFSSVCTHLGCTVEYKPDLQKITCACHGGQYDAHTGLNIAGPPPKPLTKFAVKVEKGSVEVSRV